MTRKQQRQPRQSQAQRTAQMITIGQCEQWIGRLWMQLQLAQGALRQTQAEMERQLNQERVHVGQLKRQVDKLGARLAEREENLIALNTRLMRRAAPREVVHGSGGKNE